ncbi:hypothetical protein GYA25_02720 [Candidatus Woesearchaeota archaeon]|nr:hypothetical protein [Candidatus Woesearchaeota archaeon]
MLQPKFIGDLENNFQDNFEEIDQEVSYPIYFYPKLETSKPHICKLDYALTHYNSNCESCEKLKEEALSKNISSVLMDEYEEHIIKLLS